MTQDTKTIRLGIVGCGNIMQLRHLPALRQARGIEVVALSDVDVARLRSVADEFKVAHRYQDYRELVESGGVDAVAVCTPPRFHAVVALAALRAGKHVFVEKPLALSLEECDGMIERAAHDETLKVLVGFNLRWHRLLCEARDAVFRGELGEVKLVRTAFTSGVRLRADFAEWRRRQETGGGALFELGVHHFDLMRFLLGSEAAEVYATSATGDETAIVAARMLSGAQVVAAFSEATGENHEIEIYGDKGWLRVACYCADGLGKLKLAQYPGAMPVRLRRLKQSFLELPQMLRQSRRGGDTVASYAGQWQHFAEAITRDAPVQSTLVDGRRALEIALAAWESNSTKRAVTLTSASETMKREQSIETTPAYVSRT